MRAAPKPQNPLRFKLFDLNLKKGNMDNSNYSSSYEQEEEKLIEEEDYLELSESMPNKDHINEEFSKKNSKKALNLSDLIQNQQ